MAPEEYDALTAVIKLIKMSLSIILASSDRTTINRMIDSIINQKDGDDELLVIGPKSLERFHVRPLNVKHLLCEPGNNWGHSERNFAIPFAKGSHLWFVDDDDIIAPGAIHSIKKTCAENPGRPIMFRMADPNGLVLWCRKEVVQGNQGTPQLIVPNDPERLGVFGNRYEGDFDFAVSTLEKYPPNSLVWSQHIIYVCRPKTEG